MIGVETANPKVDGRLTPDMAYDSSVVDSLKRKFKSRCGFSKAFTLMKARAAFT
jgi:hypothetical protein